MYLNTGMYSIDGLLERLTLTLDVFKLVKTMRILEVVTEININIRCI